MVFHDHNVYFCSSIRINNNQLAMKDFFRMMLASMVGFILASIIFSLLSLVMFAMVIAMIPGEEVQVPKGSVLHVKLDMPIQDRGQKSPFDAWGGMGGTRPLGLNQIVKSLEYAAEDDRITGIYLEMGVLQGGLATVDEIREALTKFAGSGKPVLAYGNQVSQRSYYLATASNKLYLNPYGIMDFSGLTANVAFVKGLSEKLKVEIQVIRPENNNYKSAVEPFLLDKMSEANREQTSRYLQSGWDRMLTGISAGRNIDTPRLNELADSLHAFRPEKALQHGLVDGLLYQDEFMDTLKKVTGLAQDQSVNMVTLSKYIKATEKAEPTSVKKGKSRDRIAVVYATGNIVMGEGEDMVISSEHISSTIRKARKDKRVKAIVLRINSGGGDGLASEIIWREVNLAVAEKPVIVSMGDYAASGGYYIACPASRIVAQPGTLTGSIGAFGVIPNLQGLFREHFGITFDEVKTNKNSSIGNLMRPMAPYEMAILQGYVDDFYKHFVTRVAEGRKMTTGRVDSLGHGRVWSGLDALELGLVDEIGGLQDAIRIAAEVSKTESYRVVEWPVQTDPFTKLLRQMSGETRAQRMMEQHLGVHFPMYEMLKTFGEMRGIQARIPFILHLN
jgi:protease IV